MVLPDIAPRGAAEVKGVLECRHGDGRKVERRRTEGGTAHGRRTNVGRKAEATDQFRPPRCGLCVMKPCAPGPSSASSSCQTLPDGVSPNTEGGQTADGRWTDRFWPPHWRSIGYEHCNDETVVAVIRPDWGQTLAPSACRHGCH